MVTDNHYRWDFIGLSTDEKPTPATSDKVVDGSTFYCSDNSKLYVFCKTQWYEKTATGGGGGTTYTAGDGINITDDTISADISAIQAGLDDFTGTDGTDAGAAGLVPAPTATDADKFLKSDGTWATAGGGGGATVVDEPGISTTDVMSQKAVTGMIFRINANDYSDHAIKIGGQSNTSNNSVAIGYQATCLSNNTVAIGDRAQARGTGQVSIGFHAGGSFSAIGSVAIGRNAALASGINHAIALGDFSKANYTGEMNIGTPGSSGYGYNNSDYRLLTGVYDGQNAHDAATKGQLDAAIINGGTTAPTTATVGTVGTLYSCVESGTGHLYICTAVSGSTYTWSQLV